uniref:Rho GTPase-activating protein n=1 Tax=Panagrolaimus sp. ES5 TaxID=591445 RepID=A0AC34GY26_9BILA
MSNNLFLTKSRSASWSDASAILSAAAADGQPVGSTYNIARGLLTIYNGSAFLPAFVVDDCYAMLDDTGFEFVRMCLKAIEEKGLREQGLYRNCGVTSKVQRLMQLALDKRKGTLEKLNLQDDSEWETKTISSAVKTFLRNLPEPLMTFELHNLFINAAKLDDIQQRVNHIHYYVYKLPESHRKMLEIIIRHLRIVADNCNENLMTVGNLGVCFGPTLLRPQEETMAAIMDIKFCNVVVEVLISNCQTIFNTPSPMHINLPCPPKPAHNILASSNGAQTTPSKNSGGGGGGGSGTTLPDGYVQNSARIFSSSGSTTSSQSPGSGTQSSTASSAAAAAMIRQRQPPPPPKGVMPQYDKVPYESRSSDDLTVAVPNASSTSSSMYPALGGVGGNQNNRYQPPRIIEGGISTRVPSNSDDRIGTSSSSSGIGGTSNTLTRNKYSATYAQPYNPQACDNVHANLAGHIQQPSTSISTGGTSVNGGDAVQHQPGPSRTAPQPPTFNTLQPIHTTRIPPQYSSLINPEVQCQPSRRVKTLYSCTAGHETELSFEPGQIITNVYESKEEGWMVGTLNGKTGLIPANYVEPLPGPH